MTAKEQLERVKPFNMEIDRKIRRLEDLYADITRTTSTYSEVPGRGNNTRSFEERMNRYLLLRDEINADIDRLVDLKTEIRARIDALPDERYRSVLEMHYLEGMTFPAIAQALNYSLGGIEKLHRKALREISDLNS